MERNWEVKFERKLVCMCEESRVWTEEQAEMCCGDGKRHSCTIEKMETVKEGLH